VVRGFHTHRYDRRFAESSACTSNPSMLERKRDQRKGREEGGEKDQMRKEMGEADKSDLSV
jgi:hypothetical protein